MTKKKVLNFDSKSFLIFVVVEQLMQENIEGEGKNMNEPFQFLETKIKCEYHAVKLVYKPND